jgi:hypothetical protein
MPAAGTSALWSSKTDGNVLGSAKVVKRTSLRGRMLANGPPWPASARREPTAVLPARTPVACTGGTPRQ